jgi:lipopolysaccharide transport system permease protein
MKGALENASNPPMSRPPASHRAEGPGRGQVAAVREVVIRAEAEPFLESLLQVWRCRELLAFLAWRDVKVRYKQTALGAAWAVLQPAGTMLVFTLLFGGLAKMPSDGIPYALFAYGGLLPWTFFQSAVTNSSNSLVNNVNLVTKVYFPRLIIPIGSVLAGLIDFAVACVLLFPLQLYYGVYPGHILLVPALLGLLVGLAAGVGLWASALNVYYRDVRYAQPFLLQLWMFLTPIIYPLGLVPEPWRWIVALNPLVGIISGFRAALFDLPIEVVPLAISIAVTGAVLSTALLFFRRMESRFADVI